MLNPRENFLETVKKGGKPDRLVKQYEGLVLFNLDPVGKYVRGDRFRGMPATKDRWGTTILWPEDQAGAMPHVTDTDKVITDITDWRNQVEVPDILAHCSNPEVWEPALEAAAKIDRENNLLMGYMPTGVFEQLHFLMGFEDTLVNFLIEPEAMHELCQVIGEFRFNYAKLIVDNLKPDVMLSHDDWGSKTNLFMRPETWREFIKPQYEKTYQYIHDQGVKIIHHSDSFLEPIIEDMVDLKIDVWQGGLPQNDIPAILKQLDGRMTLMGGLDAGIVDREDSTEEEIRREVRKACEEYGSCGHFIPSITYGGPGTIYPEHDVIINDEIDKYNREVYGISE